MKKLVKTRIAAANNLFHKLVFDLNSESQKETVFLTIPEIFKESFNLQRWKNKQHRDIDLNLPVEFIKISAIRESGVAKKTTTPHITFKYALNI